MLAYTNRWSGLGYFFARLPKFIFTSRRPHITGTLAVTLPYLLAPFGSFELYRQSLARQYEHGNADVNADLAGITHPVHQSAA
jgi:hypothetical protein